MRYIEQIQPQKSTFKSNYLLWKKLSTCLAVLAGNQQEAKVLKFD